MKQVKNESGITLIEVLATLTIMAIIGSAVYAVLFQTLHANEKTKSHNELRQEANIVITQLRTIHENNEDLYSNADMLYRSPDNPLVLNQDGTKKFSFLKVEINGTNKLTPGNATPVKSVEFSSSSTDTVYIQMADQYGNKYELKTILPGKTDLAINVPVPGEINNNPDPNLGILACPQNSFDSNVNYTVYPGNYVVEGDWILDKNDEIKITGNLTVKGNLIMGNNYPIILVEGNAIFEKEVDMKNKSQILIKGEGTFNGDISMNNKSEIKVNGDAYFGGVNTKTGTIKKGGICVNGKSTFANNS